MEMMDTAGMMTKIHMLDVTDMMDKEDVADNTDMMNKIDDLLLRRDGHDRRDRHDGAAVCVAAGFLIAKTSFKLHSLTQLQLGKAGKAQQFSRSRHNISRNQSTSRGGASCPSPRPYNWPTLNGGRENQFLTAHDHGSWPPATTCASGRRSDLGTAGWTTPLLQLLS